MLRHGEQRNFSRGIFAIFVSAALLLTSAPTMAANASQMPTSPPAASVSVGPATALPSKVKVTANLQMRSGPSTAYKVLVTIPKGTSVKVSARASSGWYKVSYGGRTGWISNKYVSVVGSRAPAPTPSAFPSKVKTTANLNMRSGPSTKHKVLVTIPRGTSLKVTAKASSGWYKVSYSGRTGWISNRYVTTGSVAPAPAAPRAPQSTGPNRTSRVVLTFDDCPRTLGSFNAAIKYAAGNDMGLVLAPTGNCLSSFKSRYGVDLAASARAKGQWVINHSVSHKDLRTLSCAGVAAELGGTGVHTNFGRPPYGAIDAGVRCGYDKVGMAIWTWSRDTMDWSVKSKAITVARASAARPGDTVLMHMQWQGFDSGALKAIKANLAKRGVKTCRAYRGSDGKGAIVRTPVKLPSSLPC